jgi:hypothetical protein
MSDYPGIDEQPRWWCVSIAVFLNGDIFPTISFPQEELISVRYLLWRRALVHPSLRAIEECSTGMYLGVK